MNSMHRSTFGASRSASAHHPTIAWWMTLLCWIGCMVMGREAAAFPASLVHERNWGSSAPWTTFTVLRQEGQQVELVLRVGTLVCRDPAGRLLCPTTFVGRSDLVAHVFSQSNGREVQAPMRCTDRRCTQTLTLPRGTYAVMVHGGPSAEGIVRFVTEINASGGSLRSPVSMSLSDNVVIDVSGPRDLYEVHSVLVPDGPTVYDEETGALRSNPAPGEHGNLSNDWLGVDATEAWLLDEQFRVLDADLAMSGVGAAAMLPASRVSARDDTGQPFSRGRYLLVRPYARAPFAVGGAQSQVPFVIDDREYPRAPGAGKLRVLLNPMTDFDGDRLGDELESQLGTCGGNYPFTSGNDDAQVGPLRRHPCMLESAIRGVLSSEAFSLGVGLGALRSDPRDTDGDGLSDGAEVLGFDRYSTWSHQGGVVGSLQSRIEDASQTLPLWGFDPRHKDVLVELDRWSVENECSSTPTDCSADGAVYPIRTATSGLTVEQAFEGLWQIRRNYAALPAIRANNPDGRRGVEVHFDVRFAREATAHGMVPRTVPVRLVNDTRTPFAKPGLVTFVANAGGSGRCACDPSQMQLDRRHAGVAHWVVGTWGGGGSAGFASDIDANIGDFGMIAHEFGHALGLEHGGPSAIAANPFSPRRANDRTLEDKLVLPSMMTYAYGYQTGGAEQWRIAHDRNAFSVGRNLALPLPRAYRRGEAYEYLFPEANTFAALGRSAQLAKTDVISLWSAIGTGTRFPMLDCALGDPAPHCRSVDFNRNRAVDTAPVAGSITSGSSEAGSTVLGSISGYYCGDTPNGQIIDAGNRCCPRGTTRSGDTCTAPDGTQVAFTSGELHSMFMQAQMAGFVGNRRLYGVFLDDEVSEDDAPTPPRRCTGAGCAPFSERGKVRWQAIDRITGARSPVVNGRCATPADDCAACGSGDGSCRAREFRGDVLLDGAPWLVNGRGGFSASASLDGTQVMVVSANRTGIACPSVPGDDRTWGDCPWGSMRVGLGRTAEFERVGLRSITIPGAPIRVASASVAAWKPRRFAPPEWVVVMRDAATDQLFWSRCDPAGTCSTAQSFGADRLSSGQIALVPVRYRLGIVRLALVRSNDQRELVMNEIGDGASLAFGPDRRARNQGAPVPTLPETALSAAATSNGQFVVSAEVNGRITLLTTLSSVLGTSGDIPVTPPVARDWNASRSLITHRSHWSNGTVSEPVRGTPGMAFALVFDGRPTAQAVAPLDGARDAQLDSTMSEQVRAFAAEVGQTGPFFRFIASMGQPTGPQFDWDETGTLAFTPCLTIASKVQRGTIGGDLEPRMSESLPTEDGGTTPQRRTLPLICPSVTIWREGVPINNIVPEFVVGPRRLRPGEDIERIAELVTSPGWNGIGPVEPVDPTNDRALPPVGRCVVGNEGAAWMQYQQQNGGPR